MRSRGIRERRERGGVEVSERRERTEGLRDKGIGEMEEEVDSRRGRRMSSFREGVGGCHSELSTSWRYKQEVGRKVSLSRKGDCVIVSTLR